MDAITASPIHQRVLSKKLEDHQFSLLLEASSPANKAQLLSMSAPHAARHNHLRNVLVESCHCAHLGVGVESGSGLTQT